MCARVHFILELAYISCFLVFFQGCIPLHGCQVNELSANPDEPGRHLFEIVPGELERSNLVAYVMLFEVLV